MSAMPDEILLRIFEVRIFPSLPLYPPSILAIFLPSPLYLTRVIRERIEPAIRCAGIPVEYYDRGAQPKEKTNATPDDLMRFVTKWMCARLETRGQI